MSRFIAVVHGWHVESKGFDVHELKSDNKKDAEREACWLMNERDKKFDRCAYTLLEIEVGDRLVRGLTWRERITGWLNP